MFNLGTKYDLTMCELGDNGYIETEYRLWTAIDVAMPIVKFSRDGDEWIVNVSLPLFVRAGPSNPEL
jgi:hypothetical protein